MIEKTDNTFKQRLTLTSIHFIALMLASWILFGYGEKAIFNIFGTPVISSALICRMVIFSCGLIYFIRLCITSFVLLKRQMPWNEVLVVGPFVAFIQILFAILTIYHKQNFNCFDWLLIGLFFLGSYLNTGSEWQRMAWKSDPSNTGKLYTVGLFKYSMHINFLGDSISFTAFGLLTGSIWGLSIPFIMTLGFIFFHIPQLDKYLQARYHEQFDEYASKTHKFIPWIY